MIQNIIAKWQHNLMVKQSIKEAYLQGKITTTHICHQMVNDAELQMAKEINDDLHFLTTKNVNVMTNQLHQLLADWRKESEAMTDAISQSHLDKYELPSTLAVRQAIHKVSELNKRIDQLAVALGEEVCHD